MWMERNEKKGRDVGVNCLYKMLITSQTKKLKRNQKKAWISLETVTVEFWVSKLFQVLERAFHEEEAGTAKRNRDWKREDDKWWGPFIHNTRINAFILKYSHSINQWIHLRLSFFFFFFLETFLMQALFLFTFWLCFRILEDIKQNFIMSNYCLKTSLV